jgi:hypothetical protein
LDLTSLDHLSPIRSGETDDDDSDRKEGTTNTTASSTTTTTHHNTQQPPRRPPASPGTANTSSHLTLCSHLALIVSLASSRHKENPPSPSRTVLARLRVTRPLHHLSSGLLRSCPCLWPSSPCPDRSLATCKPRFPRLGLGNALRLTQPLRPRPTPFGSSCISSRHPRPNRLFRCSHPTRPRPKPGRIFPSPRCPLEYKA